MLDIQQDSFKVTNLVSMQTTHSSLDLGTADAVYSFPKGSAHEYASKQSDKTCCVKQMIQFSSGHVVI